MKNKISGQDISLSISALGLFGIIFVNTKWLLIFIQLLLKQSWLPKDIRLFFERSPQEIVTLFIGPLRGSLFILVVACLGILIWKDIEWEKFQTIPKPRWFHIFFIFVTLSILSFPQGLMGLGQEYANTSLVIFSKFKDINSGTRFLLPAIANVLFFRGEIFYYIFSLICNLVLIYCVSLWFSKNEICLSFFELLSIGTISFIIFQFYVPGYPDVLVHILILLALTLPLGERGWLSLFVLSLATHEASVFIWLVLTIFFLGKKSWLKFALIACGYFALRFASGGFEIAAISPQTVGNLTPFGWLYYNVGREILGIFFALKIGWVIIITAMIGWIQIKKWKEFFLVGFLLIAGISMTFMGIDTSRLAGWSFPALLFSWKFLYQRKNTVSKNILNITTIANLIIPPYYVGLNGVNLPFGLYSIIIRLFSK